MIGSAKLALEQGITPAYIAVGIAAGVRRFIDESSDLEQSEECAAEVLFNVSKLSPEEELTKLIMDMYRLFLNKKTLAEIRVVADKVKEASLKSII